LQEQHCKLERIVVARESQIKVLNRDVETYKKQASDLIAELDRIK